MRILIVEPDAERASRAAALFATAGIVADTLDSADDLERGGLDYDLLVLNTDAEPDALRRLRGARITIPIIALARSKGEVNNIQLRLSLFELGADDVMCFPCSGRELVARGKVLMRRAHGQCSKLVTIGPLEMDLDERRAEIAGNDLHLTRKEFAILECLALRVDRTVSKEQFLEQIYQLEQNEPSLKIIDVFICKLRKKLVEAWPPAKALIETTWGRGYIMRRSSADAATARGAAAEPVADLIALAA